MAHSPKASTNRASARAVVLAVLTLWLVSQPTGSAPRERPHRLSIVVTSAEEKGWLGVWLSDVTPRLKRRYHLTVDEGAFIVDVVDDSPADKAGLRKHDVVVAVNGQPVREADDLKDYLDESEPGEKITLEVVRDKRKLKIEARLRSKPRHLRPFTPMVPRLVPFLGSAAETYLGVDVQDLNEDLAKYFKLKRPRGALITDVEEDGPAADAGLKAGDVIIRLDEIEIEDVEQLNDVLIDEYDPGDKVEVRVIREGKEKTFHLRLRETNVPWPDRGYRLFLDRDGRTRSWWIPWSEEDLSKIRERQNELREEVEKALRKQLQIDKLREELGQELERNQEEMRRELDRLKREVRDLRKEVEQLRSQLSKYGEPK